MKSVLILAVLGACATTGTATLDREPHSTGSRVHLDLAVHADAERVFPAAIDPRLPGADRLAPQILAELGSRASIDVKLCVAPEGRVSSVEVLKSSTLIAFDQSVMADAMSWQFEALPGPANARTCERATIVYLPQN